MGEQSARYYDMEKHEHNKHEKQRKKRATSDPAQILTRQGHDVLRLHLPKLSQLNGVLDFGADEYSMKKLQEKERGEGKTRSLKKKLEMDKSLVGKEARMERKKRIKRERKMEDRWKID